MTNVKIMHKVGRGLVFVLVITSFRKVSIHTAVASGAATILVLVFGPWLLLLSPMPLLVAWSRVHLGDHTVPQTMVGALVAVTAAWSSVLVR